MSDLGSERVGVSDELTLEITPGEERERPPHAPDPDDPPEDDDEDEET